MEKAMNKGITSDKLIKGISGLSKAALDIDRADQDTIKQREEQCNGCPYQKYTLGIERCGDCGCVLRAKRKIKSEKCPQNKW